MADYGGCYYKGTFGEKGICPNPVDKAKSGIKHSTLVDGKGIPPSMSIDGANIHSMKMTKCTFQEIVLN